MKCCPAQFVRLLPDKRVAGTGGDSTYLLTRRQTDPGQGVSVIVYRQILHQLQLLSHVSMIACQYNIFIRLEQFIMPFDLVFYVYFNNRH